MTNYYARLNRLDPNGCNIKDGGRRRPAQITDFWGMENFVPTAPGEWIYTWQGMINCPVFEIIEDGDGKITATLEGGEIEIVFKGVSHFDIGDFLSDQTLRLMRLQADVDDPLDWHPMVVDGLEIGPEILF